MQKVCRALAPTKETRVESFVAGLKRFVAEHVPTAKVAITATVMKGPTIHFDYCTDSTFSSLADLLKTYSGRVELTVRIMYGHAWFASSGSQDGYETVAGLIRRCISADKTSMVTSKTIGLRIIVTEQAVPGSYKVDREVVRFRTDGLLI